jgi:exodeoxyribonuclease V alpha subunit
MDTLRGVIERITFHNEENGYTVAKLSPEFAYHAAIGAEREVAIIGNMLGVHVGASVELSGRWTVHPDYGKQFAVEQMKQVLPATIAGMEKYLGSGLIRGVGPKTAKRIVAYFGVDTLTVIEETPDRLVEVPGVGRHRTQVIQQAWAEQRAIKEVMLFLQSYGVSTSLATKIYKEYGDDAVAVVKSNPYRLARDIYGIGFLTADKIAQAMGLPADAPQRVAAGVAYALNEASEDGHLFLPVDKLVASAAELLRVAPAQAGLGVTALWTDAQVKVAPSPGAEALDAAPWPARGPAAAEQSAEQPEGRSEAAPIPRLVAEQGQLYAADTVTQARQLLEEDAVVYLTPLYYSEAGVANRLQRLQGASASYLTAFQRYTDADWTAALAQSEAANSLQLAPQQRAAVRSALTTRLAILTGGPGTGKTTTVRTILQLCDRERCRVLLAAPTGRAAKRLSETTGREAKTLHRLLEFKPAEGMAFQRHEENPLEADLVIVDEASMLDVVLTNHLLKAIPLGAHLLMVGDVDQLPSVGPGNVLADIIAAIEGAPAKGAAVVRLQTIFRQEAGSYIIANAHRINQGDMPIIDNEGARDFFLFKTEDAERAAQLCVELVTERIPRRFGIAPEDIQVLSPMHRGVAGVGALNEQLQAALNPPAAAKPERKIGARAYRSGDRIMQIRNNYEKDVYNGDMGRIARVDLEMHQVHALFDGRSVVYDFLELDELVHAYAVSVHKSQGSEFPAVVVPVLTSHYMMLQRNLLYTAVTRARQLAVLVGQPKAISIAVRNGKVAERYTGLTERLRAGSTTVR